MVQNIKVVLLSKNGILREGLSHILSDHGFTVTCTASEPCQIRSALNDDQDHDIVMIDDGLAGEGLACCEQVKTMHPHVKIVLLADQFDFDTVVQAFRWGVDGYMIKEISTEPLVGALRLVASGEKVLPSEMATSLGERPYPMGWSVNLSDVNLSEREIEVLQLLISGAANKVIGRRLGICEATVKVHVKAALRKLRVSNRTQAAIWAVQRGLVAYDDGKASSTPQLSPRNLAEPRAPAFPPRVAAYA
ncbi:MAG: response regulator transcription factor [Sphingobium sp.]